MCNNLKMVTSTISQVETIWQSLNRSPVGSSTTLKRKIRIWQTQRWSGEHSCRTIFNRCFWICRATSTTICLQPTVKTSSWRIRTFSQHARFSSRLLKKMNYSRKNHPWGCIGTFSKFSKCFMRVKPGQMLPCKRWAKSASQYMQLLASVSWGRNL